MRKLLTLFPLLALAFLTFTGCEKDKDTNQQKTKMELITQSSWTFQKASSGGMDITASVPSCYKDNVIVLNTDGSGNVNEGADVCSPSNAGNFTWSFQSNETQLNVSANLFPGGNGVINIVSLTETNLVVSQEMTIAPFPPTVVEVTMKH